MACFYGIYYNPPLLKPPHTVLTVRFTSVIIAKIIIFYENAKGFFVQTFGNLTF